MIWLSQSIFRYKDSLVSMGGLNDGGVETEIHVSSEVLRSQYFDREVRIDLADDLDGTSIGEVGVPVQQHCDGPIGVQSSLVAS